MSLFPEIEPCEHGLLDVGDGHRLYWETAGKPAGRAVVVLHGGPGSGCTGQSRLFDPHTYRIVLVDQRGAGRSRPRVDATSDLSTNTTQHLLGDLERLREHLAIERWLVWGASWGVTLGLAYAERHPERVSAMVLVSVTMTRPADIHWLYHEVGRYFPEQWQRFRAGLPDAEPNSDLVAGYYHLLNEQPDVAIREKAAKSWCDWEDSVVSLEEGWTPSRRYADPAFRITFARLVTHYFHHRAWLEDGQILREAHRLAGIPGVLIHGRLDLGGPVDTPWQLAQAWPEAELHLVGTGHQGGAEMTARIIEATNRFASSD